jgi:alpha-glucuronidase
MDHKALRGLALALTVGLLTVGPVGPVGPARAIPASPGALRFANPAATVLPVAADTYVDSRTGDTNYGSDPLLWVSRGQQMTFLRFDPAGYAGHYVTAAKLRFHASSRNGGLQQWPLMVYGITGQAWSESTATWAASPRFTGQWLEMVDGSDFDGLNGQGWYEADVTKYLNDNLGTHQPISFRIEAEAGNASQLAFASRESGANAPELVLFGDARTGAVQAPQFGAGEDGSDLWLRYPKLHGEALRQLAAHANVVLAPRPAGQVVTAAADELRRGFTSLRGRPVPVRTPATVDGGVLVGTLDTPLVADLLARAGQLAQARQRGLEGFVLATVQIGRASMIVVGSAGERGALYGAFRLLQLAQLGKTDLARLRVADSPDIQYRLNEHWDSYASLNPPDGWAMVERGYAGHSLWQMDLPASEVVDRYTTYARANAAVGINGAVINNTTATHDWVQEANLPRVAAIADALRPYGMKVYLSMRFDGPIALGGLGTADPLDPAVRQWWQDRINLIYRYIPDFGGVMVKGDSDGEPGPLQYGRTHADGANMLADALRPHGGLVIWRTFVFSELVTDPDRAKRVYQLFKPLDGKFDENVILQTKNGVVDFQPREPVTPLIGGMPHTNVGVELPVAKEYTGHSTDVNYQLPEFERIMKFDTQANGPGTPVSKVLDGDAFGYTRTLIADVARAGTDTNWTRLLLDQANWYGFGRLAWNPTTASAARFADEWARLTFSTGDRATATITSLLMGSEQAFAEYAQPLGLNFTVSLRYHFKNDVSTQDSLNGVTDTGVGVDRTVATGSGYAGLYPPGVAAEFENLATTPEDLVLFVHHVNWDTVLPQSNQTVIQRIYDLTFDGLDRVRTLIRQWDSVRSEVDERRWREVRSMMDRHLSEATNYRNVTNRYFFARSGIADQRGRDDAFTAPTATLADQTVAPGGRVTAAVSSEAGRVYLVPTDWAGIGHWEREARLALAADRLNGTTAASRPGQVVALAAPTRPGTYHLYAVDQSGNASTPSTGVVTVH